jgi:hypothetical protein
VQVAADDTRDSYGLDDAVDPVADARAGWTYKATAQGRATSATEGREVGVVVRETDRSGGGLRQVGDAETRVRMSVDGYREVSVSYTAREEGGAWQRAVAGWRSHCCASWLERLLTADPG